MNNNKYKIILKLISYLNLLLKLQDIQLKAFIYQIKFNNDSRKGRSNTFSAHSPSQKASLKTLKPFGTTFITS